MSQKWEQTTLKSTKKVLGVLANLCGKRWLCRGHPEHHEKLIPTIDHELISGLSRIDKLNLERRSIELYRSTARFFSDIGEKSALSDDIITLMVLRHYGVPTRLLDWSMSPYVAAYFAVEKYDDKDGELWTFDEPLYEIKGKEQWKKWPETTRYKDGINFDAKLTAFQLKEPKDWFVCGFYPSGFHRQSVQAGAYTLTARFDRDHAEAIANLLKESSRYHLYIVQAKLKRSLRKILRESHGIWRGSLFPDSAGAAQTVNTVFLPYK